MSKSDGAGPALDLEDVDAFVRTAYEQAAPDEAAARLDRARATRSILEDELPEPVDDTALAGALLQRVLETCEIHPSILLERYGREVQETVTLVSRRLRALDVERDPRIYWSGIERGPRAVRLVVGADRIRALGETLDRDETPPADLLDETRERLLPVLREGGESWLVERIESLLERIGT